MCLHIYQCGNIQRTGGKVGLALAEIRDARLYRADFATFEDYCREKWGWTRMRASQLIEAASVKVALPENVNHGLQNERQARELAKVEPAKRVQVLEKAANVTKAQPGTTCDSQK